MIQLISAEETLDLRHRVLRPTQTRAQCRYLEDEHLTSFHVGAFQTKLVCVATFIEEPLAGFLTNKAFRLRGMATDPLFHSQGFGRRALEFGMTQIQLRSGSFLWCNARDSAFGFYQKLGLEFHGELFDIEGIGPHKVMYKYL